jgi:hypothetical protein
MAVITPETYVKLMRIELSPDNQLTFNSVQAQEDYFLSLPRTCIRRFYVSKTR